MEAPDTLFQRLGLFFVLLYLFVLISRVLDVTLPQLRIPMVLYVMMTIMALLSGAARIFRTRANWWLGLYLIWMLLAVPTSYWRGGSITHWTNAVKIFVFFLCVQVLINNWRKFRMATWVLAAGLLVSAILSRLMGDYSTGRLRLQFGTLSDPNDFAMYMIMGLCLWLLLWQTTRNPGMTAIFYMPVILLILAAFLNTGSRGGLIAMAMVLLVWIIHLPARGKFLLIGGGVAIIAIAPFVMSDYVKSRFLTIYTVDDDDAGNMEIAGRLGSSVASTESRKELFLQSVRITTAHPVFGIGPGMFPAYTDFLARESGFKRGQWQPTHNMFTQISSECGIPALLLYLIGVVEIIIPLRRVRRVRGHFPEAEGMRRAAGYLLMAFYGVLMAGMFLSIAYTTVIYVLGALAICLTRACADRSAAAAQAEKLAAPTEATPKRPMLPPRLPMTFPPRLGARS
ncbi:MAG TPA: O-antigen ligase family protein [Bryobacteraceae bacterium]|nr:O-antigen ligase family protein [Bryobacteraceae bacterium]